MALLACVLFEQLGELFSGYGAAEIIALHFIAVVLAQEVELVRVFHAFGDNF